MKILSVRFNLYNAREFLKFTSRGLLRRNYPKFELTESIVKVKGDPVKLVR